MEQTDARNIKNIIESILTRLHIPYKVVEKDPTFYADCKAAAIERGIPLEGETSFELFLHTGADMARMSYSHLEYDTRIYIALGAAASAACDDVCNQYTDLLKNFCQRFVKGVKHGHPLVDAYDSLLRELPKYFGSFTAETLLQSGIDFFVGLLWEYELQKNPVTHAKDFPAFLKNLVGLSKMSAMMAFERGIPPRSYMEAIPRCMTYVNVINDVFSFYKEELAGESINFVSIMAESSKKTKIEVLQQLADETVETYKEVTSILSGSSEALHSFEKFARGYLYFFVANKRYRIAELWEICAEE